MGASPATKLSVEEYLALERTAEFSSEYIDGELFPPSGMSGQHSIISSNLSGILTSVLAKTSCRASSATQFRVSPINLPGIAAAVRVESLGVSLPIAEIYNGVDFGPSA